MTTALKLDGLSKRYKKQDGSFVQAVESVSFSAEQGEIIALLGPNGAGKTTIIKMIGGLVLPDNGFVEICGHDNKKAKLKALAGCAAVLEGARNIYWRLSVNENIEYFARLRGLTLADVKERRDYLLELLELQNNRNEAVRNLSRGNQQKVSIACAMIGNTQVLLLDEPTLGLDIEISSRLRGSLTEFARKENKLLLITTHDMKLVEETVERTIIINYGRIITDDKVSNLKNLFRSIAYKISFEFPVPDNCLAELKSISGVLSLEKCATSALDFTLNDFNTLYTVMEILSRHQQNIVNIETENLDFEKIFLNLLKKNK